MESPLASIETADNGPVRLGRSARLRLPWRLTIALVTCLLVLAVPSTYWAYANYLPPLAQPEIETPNPNGYEVALKAIQSGGTSREGFDLPWGDNGIISSLSKLPFQTPPVPAYFGAPEMREPLTAVRKTFALKWRVPNPKTPSDDATRMFIYAAHAFAAESRCLTDRGDWTAGLSSAVDAIELGSKVCKFGAIGDRILGQTCQNIGLTEIERIYAKLPGPAIAVALPRIRRLRQEWPAIAESLEIERTIRARTLHKSLSSLKGKNPLEVYSAARDLQPATSDTRSLAYWIDWEAWQTTLIPLSQSLHEVDTFHRALSSTLSKPWSHGEVPEPTVVSMWAKPHLSYGFGQYRGEWPRHNLAILETALAVRLFRLESGQYPVSLERVPKSILPEVPHDVWGRPVRFRLRDGRPLAYSLGADGRDDGGRAVDPVLHIRSSGGDLVFGKLTAIDWKRVN